MLNIGRADLRNCQGISRRELLHVGGLAFAGLTLADCFEKEATRARGEPPDRSSETSCIFIFLEGGPSQLEMFDPKPMAPNDIRGPFGTIPTSVPGTRIGELLPMMARITGQPIPVDADVRYLV